MSSGVYFVMLSNGKILRSTQNYAYKMNLFPIRKGKFLFQLMASLTLAFSEGDATFIVTGRYMDSWILVVDQKAFRRSV